jgi:protein required for attachment to host cells
MASTWILCPNLWGARLFRYSSSEGTGEENLPGTHSDIAFMREFPRPKVQTRLEDFHDDDDADEISSPVEDPELERRVADDFMTYVARELEKSAREDLYSELILCAEIHLLKILQGKLGIETSRRVIGAVPQDLYEVNESDLIPYVRDLLTPQSGKGRKRGRRAA